MDYKQLLFFILFLFPSLLCASNQQESHDDYEKALQAYYEEKPEDAYIYVKNALQKQPNYVPAKILLGNLLLDNNYSADAVIVFKEALTEGGDLEVIIEPLSRALLIQQHYIELTQFKLTKRLSNNTKAKWHVLRAKAYSQLKEPELELKEYQIALRLAPDSVSVLNDITAYYFINNNIEKAEPFLNKALLLEPNNHQSIHLQGQILKQQNQADAASSAFLKVLTIEPTYTDAQRSLARLYIDDKNDTEALKLIDKVLIDSPNDLRAMLLKANILLEKEQEAEAKAVLNELNEKTSLITKDAIANNDWILFINGVSAYLLKKYELAIRDLKSYLNKNPDNFYAVGVIANAYIKLEQQGYARDLLAKYTDDVVNDINMAITLANLYLSTNRLLKVDELVQQLSLKHPENIEILLIQAKLFYARSQNLEAIKILETQNNKSRNAKIESYLVDLYMRTNQPAKAAILINELLKTSGQNLELMNAMSAALIQLELYKPALKVINHILAVDKYYFPARFHLGTILLANKQPNGAKIIAQGLIKERRKNIRSHLLLAKSEIALGNSTLAIEALNELLRIDRSSIEALELLTALLKLTGQNEQALAMVNRLLEANRLAPQYIKVKAEILMRLNDKFNLNKQFNVLSNLWHDDADNLITLSNLQRRAGNLSGARKSINRALEVAPKSDAVRYHDTKLSIFETDSNSAEKKLKSLNNKIKNNDEILALEGDFLTKNGKLLEAQTKYLKAFELNPRNGLVLVKAYNLAKLKALPEEFEELLLKTLNTQENNFYYRNLLADYYLHQQRYLDAKEHYLRIKDLKKLPNKAGILNNLAYVSMHDDLDSALSYAKEATELSDKSANILDTYGWILSQKELFAEALSVLREAQSLDARSPEIAYHLAYTLNKLGKDREAKEQLKKVKNSRQNFDGRNEAITLLENL